MADPAPDSPGAKQVAPYQVGINPGTAYWMARCARAAYCRKENGTPDEAAVLADLGADNGFLAVVPFHDRGASAVLIEHRDYFALAFRGTDEPRDWLDNVNAIPTAALFGSFHRGFFRATARLWPSVMEYYHRRRKELHDPNGMPKALFLTGHSLGGAMATVAAAHLIDRDFPFTGVYTFGQPRTMSPKTADIFNVRARNRFYRFQNNNDVVSRVPARVSGYSHVGTYVHILQSKRIVQEPGFWLQFLDLKAGIADDIVDGDLATFEDHRMEDYLFAIAKWDVAW